jgi:RimJ/RimL family protein N-acetyltransferase
MHLRRAKLSEATDLANLYLRTRRALLPTVPIMHPDDDIRRWYREYLLPKTETWVAIDGSRIVGYLSLSDHEVIGLYLEATHVGRGIGTSLIELAKKRRPEGLQLYTFQINHRARRFYERHGFRAVDQNDGSRNEEREPDILYRWRTMPE